MDRRVIVYTVQHGGVLGEIERSGIYRQSWDALRSIDEDNFDYWARSYRWMMAQYLKRKAVRLRHPPVWVWTKKPDMRSELWSWDRNSRCVRFALEVPDELPLLSDFEEWHAVINQWPCLPDYDFNDVVQARLWDAEADRLYADRRLMRKSWDAIFDLERCIRFAPSIYRQRVQGIIPHLDQNQIIEVESFSGRKKCW